MLRLVRDVCVIIACVCVVVMTVQVLYVEAKVGRAVQQIDRTFNGGDPQPAATTTGCPFGPDACGG